MSSRWRRTIGIAVVLVVALLPLTTTAQAAPAPSAGSTTKVDTRVIGQAASVLHTGRYPHVPRAFYKGKKRLNWNPGPGFGPGQVENIRKAIRNLNRRLNFPPLSRVRDCDNPGKCIKMRKGNYAGSWDYGINRRAKKPDLLFIDTGSLPRLRLRHFCFAGEFAMNMHQHRKRGCMSVVRSRITKRISNAEAKELNSAYCVGIGCGIDNGRPASLEPAAGRWLYVYQFNQLVSAGG